MDRDLDRNAFARLEDDLAMLFPNIGPVRVSHRWGGPVSVPLQPAPALGYAGGERVVYSLGCMGHGLALAHLNGWTLADLLRGERTDRTENFFVNRTVLPWPPEPLRLAVGLTLRGLLRAEEAWHERGVRSLATSVPGEGPEESPSPTPERGDSTVTKLRARAH
jgi:hypothetical protein